MTNQSQQRETVIGVFADMDAAQQATQRLQDAGFRPDAIGALMPTAKASRICRSCWAAWASRSRKGRSTRSASAKGGSW
jgi:hypothetical protein